MHTPHSHAHTTLTCTHARVHARLCATPRSHFVQEGNASKHKPKVKHDAAALQPPTPGSASRIRWVLVGLSSVILTAISAYCLVQVALQAPLWNVQFMLYPYVPRLLQ